MAMRFFLDAPVETPTSLGERRGFFTYLYSRYILHTMFSNVFKGFRDFILRGNALDLAVGVIVGAAFNTLVQALVKDLFTPLIAAVAGQPDFSHLSITVHGSQILYGDFLNALISFIIVATALYFVVILPMNSIAGRFKKPKSAVPQKMQCPECLSEIPKGARRCPYCTSQLKS